uniref:N-acetyltransferase domain-containing protein n=1 Tax=viral metagenome TaxID=1070528 RepID=A0A6C0HQ80_9ZZZZ
MSPMDKTEIKRTLLANNLTMSYVSSPTYKKIILEREGDEVGRFSAGGGLIGNNPHIFDTGETIDMGISLDDDLQKHKLSKLMVAALCKMLILEYPKIRKDQFFLIDSDASGGFWDAIGMKEGRYSDMEKRVRYGNKRKMEGEGYHKIITFSDMSYWALHERLGDSGEEKKRRLKNTNKKTHKKKGKKTRRNVKSRRVRLNLKM